MFIFYFVGARYDDQPLPRLHSISAVGFLSDSLFGMEEVFRGGRQQRDFGDIEQGKGDSRVEQIKQSRKGTSE